MLSAISFDGGGAGALVARLSTSPAALGDASGADSSINVGFLSSTGDTGTGAPFDKDPFDEDPLDKDPLEKDPSREDPFDLGGDM